MQHRRAAATVVLGVTLCALWADRAHAQQRYGMLVLELPGSARAAAFGDAFPPGVQDADALHYGPAFDGSLRGFSAGFGWWSEEAVSLSLAAGGEWWGGALGGSVQSLDYESSAAGYSSAFDAESALGADAPLQVSERVASLAYARTVWELEASVTAKVLELRTGGDVGYGAAVDVAVGRELGPVRLALAGRHLGPALEVSDVEFTLPARVTLSATTERSIPLGPLDLAATTSVSVREDGEILPAGGVEIAYWPIAGRTFFARFGLQRADAARRLFTFGAGFSGDQIGLDWAYVPYEDGAVDGAHRVSVRLR